MNNKNIKQAISLMTDKFLTQKECSIFSLTEAVSRYLNDSMLLESINSKECHHEWKSLGYYNFHYCPKC